MKSPQIEWSDEETLKLQILYKKYKREWSIINKELNNAFHNNRTSAQCRYHFIKVNKGWKQKQIELLIYKKLQGTDWNDIGQLFPGKSEKQLEEKYNTLINTDIFNKINQEMNQENQQLFEIKTIQQKLTVEIIPSFKFKHWSTPDLPNLQKMINKGRRVILNDFKV